MTTTKKETKPKTKPVVSGPANQKASAIAKRAMLVELNCRRWHPHKTDRVLSQEVADRHQSDTSMGKYRKRLLKKESLMAVQTVINKVRDLYYFYTLPWSNDGQRILTNTGYFAFTKKLAELRKEFDSEVSKFLSAYPELIADAKTRIARFDGADYPSPSEMKTKFGIAVNVSPIPQGADFRVDMSDVEAARIRREIEAQSEETVKQAMSTVMARLRDVVEHAAKRLDAYKVGEDGKVEHTFRDSLVTNIVELLDVVPALNVVNDPAITQFAADIRKGLTANPGTVLRDDEKVRKDTARRAQEILSKMEAFMA